MGLQKSLTAVVLSVALIFSAAPLFWAAAVNYGPAATGGGPRPYWRPPATATAGSNLKSVDEGNLMSNLKARADAEITRRRTSLKGLINRVNAMMRLSASQKSDFVTEIQNDINDLSALQTKIDADTDLMTLRADVKSIVADYRVYLVFMPQVTILSFDDRMGTIVTNMNTVLAKLSARVSQAQGKGKNVGNAPALLSDAKAKLTDASSQLTNVMNEVTPLTPDGYPGNEATLKSARTTLQTVFQTDLKGARRDMIQVFQILRGLSGNSVATPSAATSN